MGWSRALAAVVGCGVLAAGVAGCTGDDPGTAPSPSPSVTTSTSVPSTPAPTAAPVAPVLPAAAKKPTEAGARAFIAYYWALINYAQVTGDVKGLEKVSGPNCRRCSAGIDALRTLYIRGGHLTAANYEVTEDSIKRLKTVDSGVVAFESRIEVSNEQHVSVAANGATDTFEASTVSYIVDVLWTGQWRLDVMERA